MTSSETPRGAGYWYASSEDPARSGTDSADTSRADDTHAASGAFPHGAEGNRSASGVDVLNALRSYRSIESGLRRRLSQRLGVNETDLSALRYMFGVWHSGEGASPKELALALSISSASTTLVIDRLEKAGFIRRRRHPVDRRAVILEPGQKATDEFRDTFDIEKRGVLKASEALGEEELEAVASFLRSMEQAISDAIDEEDTPTAP